MTPHRPSPAANKLLDRLALENEPLAGDLREEFARRQSEWWLWRQLITASAITALRGSRPTRLQLLDAAPPAPEPFRRRTVNLSASPLPSIGGLGLFALLLLTTLVAPEIWWLWLGTVLAGILLGGVLIVRHRQGVHSGPPHDTLFARDTRRIP